MAGDRHDPDAHEATDEDLRARVLDAAGATGPSVVVRRRGWSPDADARRRIVARAHERLLRALAAEGAAHPFAVVYTHSHWDHVFGGIFQDGLEIELGGATVAVRHLHGDHSAESSVMYVESDRVLFLGDCTYPSPSSVLTRGLAFPLHEAILAVAAEHYVEGHHPSVLSRHEMEQLVEKMRLAERAAVAGHLGPATI